MNDLTCFRRGNCWPSCDVYVSTTRFRSYVVLSFACVPAFILLGHICKINSNVHAIQISSGCNVFPIQTLIDELSVFVRVVLPRCRLAIPEIYCGFINCDKLTHNETVRTIAQEDCDVVVCGQLRLVTNFF